MGVKVGDQIRIIHLTGEDSRYDGREGTVEYIDAIGQLHGTWGGLAVIPEEDEFVVIGQPKNSWLKGWLASLSSFFSQFCLHLLNADLRQKTAPNLKIIV